MHSVFFHKTQDTIYLWSFPLSVEAVYLHITFMFAIISECLLDSEIRTDFYMSTVLQEYDPLKKKNYYNTWLYLYQPAKWIQIGNRHREAGKSWSPWFYWVQVGIFEVQRSWPSGQTDSRRWYREQEARGKWKTEKADSLCISCTRVLQMVFQWHALICIKW